MWAPILEKAWAKIKGNYEASEGGYIVSGITHLLGVPTFSYQSQDIGKADQLTLEETFKMLKQAELSNYIISVATPAGDAKSNACGMVTSHAYSILSAFEMTDQSGMVHKMILLRNPWGSTLYN